MAGRVIRVERINDPAREAEKKRLYGTNQSGAAGDQKFWAIARGKLVGVVVGWDRVVPQITNCKKPVCYAAFNSEAEAWSWLTETKKKLQRKLKKTRKVTKTRQKPGGKKGEEEEYETEEDYTSFEDTSEEELEKSKAPRRPAPPPPPKKFDEANVDTSWMGSQRYVTDKVWLVEEEAHVEEEEKEADVDLSTSAVAKTYTIGGNIGRGAIAVVKSGLSKQGAKVALKVVSKQLSPDFDPAAAAVEAAALQAVKGHPNIVSFIESFSLPDGSVFVLELLGQGLFPFLAGESKPYHEDDAQRYVRQLVNAVEALHAKGYVHRDIVPENLLLTPTGEIKLIGFSMTKGIKDSLPFDGLVGTPALQPPEVIMRQAITKTLDVWSIGCLTYALLSGKFPFQDSNVMRLNIKIRKAEFDLTSPEWGAVSPSAKDFLKAALNPNAKERLTSQGAKEHAWLKSNAPHTALSQFRANIKASVDSNAWN